MNIVGTVAALVLVLELFLVAVSALLGLEVWRQRMLEVTGWRVTPPARWAILGFTLIALACIAVGFTSERAAAVGGALCAGPLAWLFCYTG